MAIVRLIICLLPQVSRKDVTRKISEILMVGARRLEYSLFIIHQLLD